MNYKQDLQDMSSNNISDRSVDDQITPLLLYDFVTLKTRFITWFLCVCFFVTIRISVCTMYTFIVSVMFSSRVSLVDTDQNIFVCGPFSLSFLSRPFHRSVIYAYHRKYLNIVNVRKLV